VLKAYNIYGGYDTIAKVKAEPMDRLKHIVTWRVRKLGKVGSRLTIIAMETA